MTQLEAAPDRGLPDRIENHAERSVEELTPPLYKPRLRGLLAAFGAQVQIAEDDFNGLVRDRLLDVATGASLDQYGALVGEPRSGLDDATYRTFIKAKVLANGSKGEAWRVIRIVAVLSGADYVWLRTEPPAGVRIEWTRAARVPPSLRRRILTRLAAVIGSGVRLRSVVEAPRGAFGFAEDPTALGFGVGAFSSLL